ncbi:MAG: 30S ribosomal protein S20 [Acidobacteria bacterium]|nr:MAG: 30S ribosomal protein S20 [Acidobacteriota bacterium]
MANHKSAAKQARRSAARRLRNRFWRSRMRTQIKKFRKALEQGDLETAKALLAPTLGLVDRTARAGVIHDNTASRYKSRLQRAFNKSAAKAG